VKVGDEIKRDDPILEISTDKVDAEIPAPASGVLAEIKVQEGETVEVQTVVAVLETDKDAAAVSPPQSVDVAASEPAAAAPSASTVTASPAPAAASIPPAPPPARAVGDGAVPDQTAEERLRKRSTPLVRKIAAEHQVDIGSIPGTGVGGRVTKKDILTFIQSGAAVPSPAAAPGAAAVAPSGVSHPTVEAWPGDRVEPMTKIRKLTADHMVASRRTSAHVTSFYEVDFTRIAKLRDSRKQDYLNRGARLTTYGATQF
jgi:2-oxoglutarate dehydrogenase E2 component (dihydrolipoamide succinyltransferase)